MRKLKALQAKCYMFRMLFLLVVYKGKGKGKFHPITGSEDPERECRYSSKLSLTSGVAVVGS
jgi:hypothetical protein